MKDEVVIEAEIGSKRTSVILEIKVVESLERVEEGYDLNEGYEYEVSGSIPQLADGIAKMIHEMDKDEQFGDLGGQAFLELINQYYYKLKEGGQK